MAADRLTPAGVPYMRGRNMSGAVVISERVMDEVRNMARDSEDGSETGGILLGFEEIDGSFWVTEAGGPGPLAERSPTYFCRDLDHAEVIAERAFSIDGSQWVGDWHTHPGGPNALSHVDLRSYREVLVNSDLEVFLAILLRPGLKGWQQPRATAFAVSASRVQPIRIIDLLGGRLLNRGIGTSRDDHISPRT
ncbi:MAG TPA: Mov34/MPN/PAD-1 family protein [Solirubrobacterales bacterium]